MLQLERDFEAAINNDNAQNPVVSTSVDVAIRFWNRYANIDHISCFQTSNCFSPKETTNTLIPIKLEQYLKVFKFKFKS